MKRACLIVVALCLMLPMVSSAQTLSNSQKRLINEKVWNTIEAYEGYMSMRDKNETKYIFAPLFTEDAEVICDVLGVLPYLEMMSVEDYIQKVADNTGGRGISARIYDVRMSKFQYLDGKWIVPVTFKKQLSYFDNNGIYFDINRYYQGDILDMTMNILYDEATDECHIKSINGDVAPSPVFPKGRYIIIEEDKVGGDNISGRDRRLLASLKADGKELSFDEDGIGIYNKDTHFGIKDIDVKVSPIADMSQSTEAYDIISFDLKKRSSRLKLRAAYAPFAYKVSNAGEALSKPKSNAFEVGIDYGTTFVIGRNSKMGFYIGAGVSFSNLKLNAKSGATYTYNTSVKDNGIYRPLNVKYTIHSAEESVSYTDIFVPIYFEAEHRLDAKSRFVITWNVGLKPYLNLQAKVKNPYMVTFSVSDNYEGNYLPDDKYTANKEFDNFIEPNSYKKNLYDASVFGNLGLDFGAVPNVLYIALQVGYERGFLKSYESDKSAYLGDNQYPIVPEMDEAGMKVTGHQAVSSLISGITTERNALWISLGVKLKF